MCYYRAALSAASAGDLSSAAVLVKYSILLKEDAPCALRLLEILQRQNRIDKSALIRLRVLTDARRYKKALWIKMPQTSRAFAIRGLLYAQTGRYRKAREAFSLALALDTGNDLARRALLYCDKKRAFPW